MKSKFILLTCLLLATIISQAQMRYFQANLQGSQQVPANASAGSGVVIVKYDMAAKFLVLYGDYQGLATPASASHIHSPGAMGVNAPVIIPLTNTAGTTGTLSGNATLTATQEGELFTGNMYVNVHNATYPGGEIRGQLTATTPDQTEFFNGRLQGSQQVPVNASAGLGGFTALLDKTTKMVYLTGQFSGLAAAATAGHIHVGAAHTNGAVIIPLVPSSATAGTIHGISAITDANITDMLSGNTYVNIHNAPYPGGEIRGQVNMFPQTAFFKAILQGSQQVPPNASTGKGTVIVTYNTTSRALVLVGDYQNLTTAASASHIHSPAAPGANAAVIIPLTNTGGTTGTLSGAATLTATQEAELMDGKMYVNVHNATYPGGEIRGQLSMASADKTQYLTGMLEGSQQVPTNTSAGTGSVTVLLDQITNEVFLTGNFSGLTANASAGHIHRGVAGENGPVVVPLSVTNSVAGTITGSAMVSQAFADSMVLGFTYVNIHNSSFPGGEIRAQLGNQVLPIKLSYFNGFKDRNNVTLIWESAEEVNLQQYDVEQQNTSTKQWIVKATRLAAGGSLSTKYQVTDAPSSTKEKYVIYRLKIVDKNGKFSYSPIVRINYQQSNVSLNILTNPIEKGVVRYNITGLSADKKAEVSVIDFNGRVVYKSVESSLSNHTIDAGKFAAGMYKLIVRVNDQLLQQSFIK